MNNKTRNILLTLYSIALIVMVVGATFAYFTAIRVSSVSPTVESSTAVTNYVAFRTGYDINITASTDNFGNGMSSITTITSATAQMKVENAKDPTSLKYNIYLNITTNELEYTSGDTAELLLTLTDPDGNEVKSLSGLKYTTVTDNQGMEYSGFDITTAGGTLTLVSNHEISTATSTTQEWGIKVTLVNLGTDQDANTGKTFKGSIVIEKVA